MKKIKNTRNIFKFVTFLVAIVVRACVCVCAYVKEQRSDSVSISVLSFGLTVQNKNCKTPP